MVKDLSRSILHGVAFLILKAWTLGTLGVVSVSGLCSATTNMEIWAFGAYK